MAAEYRGGEIIFAVAIPNAGGTDVLMRPFNQTGGGTSISADSIDLDTKDKKGSDYGAVSQTVSLEGVLTEGDEFVDYIKSAIRNKEMVRIYEINTRTLQAESGLYMISTFDRDFSNGDYATYSLEGALNGDTTEVTLTEVPEGA